MTSPDDAGDDADGANSKLIERTLARIPPSSPDEAAAREPYERVFAQIRVYRDPPLPAGWQADLMARWTAVNRRQRRRRLTGLVGASVVLVVAIAYMIGSGS